MLSDIDAPGATTGVTALLASVPVGLDGDYLYSTLVRPRRTTAFNVSHFQLAYGTQSGDPAALGTVVDGRA
jgi:hypothetical protein